MLVKIPTRVFKAFDLDILTNIFDGKETVMLEWDRTIQAWAEAVSPDFVEYLYLYHGVPKFFKDGSVIDYSVIVSSPGASVRESIIHLKSTTEQSLTIDKPSKVTYIARVLEWIRTRIGRHDTARRIQTN